MEPHERQVIDELFTKLRQAEQQTAPRDADAERHIAAALSQQPAAPYYMAQVILVQEQALQALNERVQVLEREVAERPATGGGFLGGLFGAPPASQSPSTGPAGRKSATAKGPPAGGRGWSAAPAPGQRPAAPADQRGGGGFLASAATTALGVAGGVMLASALTGLFAAEEALAAGDADSDIDPGVDDGGVDNRGVDDLDEGFDDSMADGGGDFDFGDF